MILPVLLVITSEHIGHQVVTGKIIGRDLLKDPGLHRSLFGDNFSTMLSGLIGSVPTTTYGENIGVMAVTKVYSVRVIAGAAVLSIICSFVGKLSMLIQTIPGPVIGGISFLVVWNDRSFRNSGFLWTRKVDYGKSRNLTLTTCCVCNRTFRYCSKFWGCTAYGNGTGVCSCHDSESDLLYTG